MTHKWDLRCPPPVLIEPVPIDPSGVDGPTRGSAYGPKWRRTSPGRFVPARIERSVEQRILESSMLLPPGGAVSGRAALRLHGANFCDGIERGAEQPVPLVVPLNVRPHDGVQVHRDALTRVDATSKHGIRVTVGHRAAYDAARWAPDRRAAVTVLDMACAARVTTPGEVHAYAVARRGVRGSRQVMSALAYVDARSKSPRETRMRLTWHFDAGLPRPWCNWPLGTATGRRLGAADLLSEEFAVIGEYDGAEHRDRLGTGRMSAEPMHSRAPDWSGLSSSAPIWRTSRSWWAGCGPPSNAYWTSHARVIGSGRPTRPRSDDALECHARPFHESIRRTNVTLDAGARTVPRPT